MGDKDGLCPEERVDSVDISASGQESFVGLAVMMVILEGGGSSVRNSFASLIPPCWRELTRRRISLWTSSK